MIHDSRVARLINIIHKPDCVCGTRNQMRVFATQLLQGRLAYLTYPGRAVEFSLTL
jgi:hypothetical protein